MSKYVMPPRQKMINLIYIVLIAMLGINISQDALEGYDLLNNKYQPQIKSLTVHNTDLQKSIEKERPEVKSIAMQIREKTDFMQQEFIVLKTKIAKAADREKYQEGKLKNREDMEATSNIMLNFGEAKKLKLHIDTYKKQMNMLAGFKEEPAILSGYLSITPQKENISWEMETFSHLTANAGMVILNKLEEELLTYEKETLLALARMPLTVKAEDTLIGKNKIYINGQPVDVLPGGTIQTPIVQVSPESGSILYKGMENKLQYTSIGIAATDLRLSMDEGKIIERNGEYWALPSKKAQVANIAVSNRNGVIAHFNYTVKELPDPVPTVVYTDQGKQQFYKGNVPFSRSKLQAITELAATVPEGPKIDYKILSFETVFIKSGGDEVITLTNRGNKFSDEQRKNISQLQPGDKFYITSVIVSGGNKEKEQIASINIVLI